MTNEPRGAPPTRRGILAALAACPIAALPMGSALAAAAGAPSRAAWDVAMAAFRRAQKIDTEFDAKHKPTFERYFAEKKAIPHVVLRPDPYSGHHDPVSTADWDFVKRARGLVDSVKRGRCFLEVDRYPSLREHYELCQEVVAAADERDARIEAVGTRYGIVPLFEQSEANGEAANDAESALLVTAAPDREALLYKLERLFGPEVRDEEGFADAWCPEWVNAFMADARLLLPQGRA